ncbi:unnamed protein product [Prunus armeniaca]|uniref:Uncharacterized protein n=1 Tax=Prunus armeniaca TaxID=36596 RepID=A0A6J5UFM4_PRUAR|nr:unnamed protein product [Prunus armeniaca]
MQTKCKEHLDLPHDGLIRVAAEALVSISSSQGHDMQSSAAHHLQERNLDSENVSEVKRTAHDEDDVMGREVRRGGQATKGLPGLASLARNEVTEDLQLMEGVD